MNKRWVWGLVPVTLAGIILSGRVATESEDKARLVPKPPLVSENPVVAISTGEFDEYTKTTLDAVRKSGGLDDLVKPGSTVFIKPNIVGPSPSGAGRITDYRVVQAIIYECQKLGAKRIVVGESPVDCGFEEGFSIASYDKLKGAELMNTNVSKDDCYYVMPERSLVGQPFYVPKIYMDADVVIDVPIMKTHYNAGVTLGLKNIGIGIPPLNIYQRGGNKAILHEFGIFKTIPDINSIRRPDLVVVDGMVGGEGKGPTEPTPVMSGMVIAGRDIVAVDSVATKVMGFKPEEITYLVYAGAASQLGVMDLSKIKVVGKSIDDVQQSFAPPPISGFPFKRTTVIRETPSAFTVDGKLDEWTDMWSVKIDEDDQMTGDAWKGTDDLSAKAMIGHDWKNLYVAFNVIDDAVVDGGAYKDSKTPAGDGVEVSLSPKMPFENDMRKVRKTRKAGSDFLLLSGVGPKNEIYDQVTGQVVAGAESAVTKTDKGYSVEMRIPVTSLGVDVLKLRDEMWVDFGISDVDEAGKGLKAHAMWTATGNPSAFDNPSNSGRAMVDAIKHPWAD